jgi:hypothetical protein
MAQLNPDPYKEGDPIAPTGRVTAIFDSISNLKAALPVLQDGGFTGEDNAIFIGEEGRTQLDASGKYHHFEALRAFQYAVSDEAEMFNQFEAALKQGGAVVAILTGDDEAKKTKATELLKANGARKINYWGKWTNEALG